MVLILVICSVSIRNSMESIPSIGSGGAGLRHWVRLTINTISRMPTIKPINSILSFIMLQI